MTRARPDMAHAVAHSRVRAASTSRSTQLARIGALVALAASLTACNFDNNPAAPSTNPVGMFRVVDVQAHGRMVPCITWKERNAGGISCDWSK